MRTAAVFLVSTDASLADTVTKAVSQVSDTELHIVSSFSALASVVDKVALVLAPLGNKADAEQIERWMQQVVCFKKAIPTVLICEQRENDLALPLLRKGAVDCLNRSLEMGRLTYIVDMLTVRYRLASAQADAAPHSDVLRLGRDGSFLVHAESSSGQILNQVERIARLDTSVLLQGETGTGKTRLARLIHELSPRREQPFLVVNSGVLSSNVIESEMFGHVRGAFTSADRDRTGKFAEVGTGTILLDDIDQFPLDSQAKLLRVVEDRVFEPVGSNRTQPMMARLIVTSNRVLSEEVAAGRFRSDLYYRLCVVAFSLPPLRENLALIAPLAFKFLGEFNRSMGRRLKGIASDALIALQEHSWPGNIRELRNVMERAVALSEGSLLQMQDLPSLLWPSMCKETISDMKIDDVPQTKLVATSNPSPSAVSYTLADAKQAAEAAHIAEALARNDNNRLRAAAELGISRMTLYNKMHAYGLIEILPA